MGLCLSKWYMTSQAGFRRTLATSSLTSWYIHSQANQIPLSSMITLTLTWCEEAQAIQEQLNEERTSQLPGILSTQPRHQTLVKTSPWLSSPDKSSNDSTPGCHRLELYGRPSKNHPAKTCKPTGPRKIIVNDHLKSLLLGSLVTQC